MPAVVCTAGSYIAFMNTEAVAASLQLSVGESLYSFMAPKDILKFEAHFEGSVNGDTFSFSLGRAGFAFAVFGSIMGRRYANVMLFESESSRSEQIQLLSSSAAPPTKEETLSFVERFIGVVDEALIGDERQRMADLEMVGRHTVKTVSALAGFSDISFTACGNGSEPFGSYCDISYGGYTRILSSMLFAADVVSSSRSIKAVLSESCEGIRLCVSTGLSDENIEVCSRGDMDGMIAPAAGYIEVCDHIAGMEKGEFSYGFSYPEKEMSFVLSLYAAETDYVEFKAPADPLLLMEKIRDSIRYLEAMRS